MSQTRAEIGARPLGGYPWETRKGKLNERLGLLLWSPLCRHRFPHPLPRYRFFSTRPPIVASPHAPIAPPPTPVLFACGQGRSRRTLSSSLLANRDSVPTSESA